MKVCKNNLKIFVIYLKIMKFMIHLSAVAHQVGICVSNYYRIFFVLNLNAFKIVQTKLIWWKVGHINRFSIGKGSAEIAVISYRIVKLKLI
jgi:hypothetical protein